MKVCVFGAGYVGLVTAACLAEMGNSVVGVDIDQARVAALGRGEVPIHEPGLDEMLRRNAAAGRLRFTTDVAAGVGHGTIVFIAVGTPPAEDGSADLEHVLAAHAASPSTCTTTRSWSTRARCRWAPPSACMAPSPTGCAGAPRCCPSRSSPTPSSSRRARR
jgi:UDP-glucose 6-dehydrogenase